MTEESGTTATSAPDRPVETGSATTATQPGVPVPAPGAPVLALLAIGWLAAMLWSAKWAITSAGFTSIAITSAAYALPGIISASLVSGAAVSLTLAAVLSRFGVRRATPRFAAALAAGLAAGLLAALAVNLSYGDGSAIMVLAGTTAAAATVGGIAGGLRNTLVVAAVVTAGLAVFAVGFALSYFQEPLLSLYGAGDTYTSQYTALQWFSWTSSLASGLAAGLLAFGYLRIAGRRAAARGAGGAALRWPAYLIAGGGPGVLLLIAEVLTRTAGAEVLRMAGAVSEADHVGQSWLDGQRFEHVMVVFFVGALTTVIAFGRTLRPADGSAVETPPRPTDPDGPGTSGRAPTELTRSSADRTDGTPVDEDPADGEPTTTPATDSPEPVAGR
ncbi:hypothetical protein [Plantactinospora sp. B5E13]|uniref:hypothetical protein n=1 Tax=unclassified Plantactinospora TaxID=2631981 RepID=UPI00325EF20C